mmetsp:Transcript_90030/g.226504  ORF Transcript_90030/g.226504 Transcript_90030/m.226504 type:complete len:581 (+) Transcript_90030:106-1848(+)
MFAMDTNILRWSLWAPSVYWFVQSNGWLLKSLGAPKTQIRKERAFSLRNFFLLCFSESFSMFAAATILWHNGTVGLYTAMVVANLSNLVGYLKYVYQMFFDPSYVTLSFHLYNAVWMWVAWTQQDPMYFLLFRYPFTLLTKVERYMNMRGRKVLCSELGLIVHTVDHILHGMICCRILFYHFWGVGALLVDALVVPFVLLLSDSMVRLQDPDRAENQKSTGSAAAAAASLPVPRPSAALRLMPVEDDKAAWRAADLEEEAAWTFCVTEAHIKEIEAALAASAEKDIFCISQADFPLPTMQGLLHSLRSNIEGGIGFGRLRGLPVKEWGEESTRRALWGIGTHIGWGEKQDKAGSLIHSVKDEGRKMWEASNIRLYQTNQEIPFHTDGCDAFMLLCLSQGQSGGRSRVTSAVTAFNDIVRRRPDLAAVLQEDFYFDARGQHPDGRACQVHPVFTYHQDQLSIIHKIPYIHSAQNLEGVPKLTTAQVEALAMLDEVMNKEEFVLEFDLVEGDAVLCSNHSLCHGRSAFADGPGSGSIRHMLRLWLTLPTCRQLPQHYAETREHMYTFARRMLGATGKAEGSA